MRNSSHYYRNIQFCGDDPIETAIEELQNDVSLLMNKKIIFIGDSYASGEIGSSWIDLCREKLPENETYKLALSGSGFTTGAKTFLGQLRELTVSDPLTITDIVVGGSYNDAMSTSTTESKIAAMQSFMLYCRLNYPNAIVHLCPVGWCIIPANFDRLRNERDIWYNFASSTDRCKFANNIEYSLHNHTFFEGSYINPSWHPNPAGNEYLSNCVLQYLKTGSCDIHHSFTATITSDYMTFSPIMVVKVSVMNGTVIVDITKKNVTGSEYTPYISSSHIAPIPIFNDYNGVDMAKINHFVTKSDMWNGVGADIVMANSSTSPYTYYKCYGTLSILGDKVHITPTPASNDEWTNYSSIDHIAFTPVRLILSAYECC